MKKLFISYLVVALLCCSFVSAQIICEEWTDCESCITNNDGICGWCSATQRCHAGNATGPLVGKCIHAWEYGVCQECAKNKDCRSCGHFPTECFWCSDTGSCLDIGYIGCKNWAETCPCEDYHTCYGCDATLGCTWCGDKELCIDTTNTSFTCQREPQCLCNFNPTCSACMLDPQCGWCDGSRTCVSRTGAPDSCALAESCEFNCERATTCESCTPIAGCGWCAQAKTCMDINTSPYICNVSPQCPAVPQVCPRKFDGGSFVGGMFMIIGILLIVAAGCVFYRKRQSKNTSAGSGPYEPL